MPRRARQVFVYNKTKETFLAFRVEVCDSTFYNVRVAELEAWLKRSGGAPRDVATKQKVRTRLERGGN